MRKGLNFNHNYQIMGDSKEPHPSRAPVSLGPDAKRPNLGQNSSSTAITSKTAST